MESDIYFTFYLTIFSYVENSDAMLHMIIADFLHR